MAEAMAKAQPMAEATAEPCRYLYMRGFLESDSCRLTGKNRRASTIIGEVGQGSTRFDKFRQGLTELDQVRQGSTGPDKVRPGPFFEVRLGSTMYDMVRQGLAPSFEDF